MQSSNLTSRNAPSAASVRRHLAAQEHLVYKLQALRALFITAHNTPQSVEKMEREFFFLVGEILEGTVVEKLTMATINREAFLRAFHST